MLLLWMQRSNPPTHLVADAALDIRHRLRHKQYSCGCGELTALRLHLTRGDLGQLAPRKKLLKSFSSFPEDFLRPSEHFGTEGFSFLPSLLPSSSSTSWMLVI